MSGIPKPESPVMRRSSMAQAGAAEKGLALVEAPPAEASAADTAAAVVDPVVHTPPSPKPRTVTKSPAAASGTSSNRLRNSRDVLLSLPEDLKDRMVNTIAWTSMHTGIDRQQKFMRIAIEELCERIEGELNQGKPFAEAAKPVNS
jgi:hypothetical protein